LPESARERFAALCSLHLKTGRAWAIKESLRELWGYRRKGWALQHLRHWYFWATHSRLSPVVKVARMIRGHLDNVVTYFEHRITNATSEGLNSKIQAVKNTLMGSGIGAI
jgi:transposase